jgi:hypothetical protein
MGMGFSGFGDVTSLQTKTRASRRAAWLFAANSGEMFRSAHDPLSPMTFYLESDTLMGVCHTMIVG